MATFEIPESAGAATLQLFGDGTGRLLAITAASIEGGTATPDIDYAPFNISLSTRGAGVSEFFLIPNDDIWEEDETIDLFITMTADGQPVSNIGGFDAGLNTIVIVDDDKPDLTLTPRESTVVADSEGVTATILIDVELSNPADIPVPLQFDVGGDVEIISGADPVILPAGATLTQLQLVLRTTDPTLALIDVQVQASSQVRSGLESQPATLQIDNCSALEQFYFEKLTELDEALVFRANMAGQINDTQLKIEVYEDIVVDLLATSAIVNSFFALGISSGAIVPAIIGTTAALELQREQEIRAKQKVQQEFALETSRFREIGEIQDPEAAQKSLLSALASWAQGTTVGGPPVVPSLTLAFRLKEAEEELGRLKTEKSDFEDILATVDARIAALNPEVAALRETYEMFCLTEPAAFAADAAPAAAPASEPAPGPVAAAALGLMAASELAPDVQAASLDEHLFVQGQQDQLATPFEAAASALADTAPPLPALQSAASESTGLNAAPVAVDDAFSFDASIYLIGDVIPLDRQDQDADPDGDVLEISAINNQPIFDGQEIVLESGGVLTVFTSGLFTYRPSAVAAQVAAGDVFVDSFEYTVTDGRGGESSATVTLDVTNNGLESLSLIAIGDRFATDESSQLDINSVVLNDFELDENPIAVDTIEGTPVAPGAEIALPSGAKVVVSTSGDLTYDTNGAFDGLSLGETAFDVFEYSVSSVGARTSTGQIAVEVNGLGAPFDARFTPGRDVVQLDDTGEIVAALAGFDEVIGGTGYDIIDGGLGRDRLDGGDGNDTLLGGDGLEVGFDSLPASVGQDAQLARISILFNEAFFKFGAPSRAQIDAQVQYIKDYGDILSINSPDLPEFSKQILGINELIKQTLLNFPQVQGKSQSEIAVSTWEAVFNRAPSSEELAFLLNAYQPSAFGGVADATAIMVSNLVVNYAEIFSNRLNEVWASIFTETYAFGTSAFAIEDTLIGGRGNDVLDGGAGFDAAEFSSDVAEYTFVTTPAGDIIVEHTGGDLSDAADTTRSIEAYVFADVTLSQQEVMALSVADPSGLAIAI